MHDEDKHEKCRRCGDPADTKGRLGDRYCFGCYGWLTAAAAW